MSDYKAVVAQAVKDAKEQLADIAKLQSFKVDKDGKPTAERHAPHAGHKAKVVEAAVNANSADAIAALKADVAAAIN